MKKLLVLILCAGCGEGWCPEEFGADAYVSGLCVKTNDIPISFSKISHVVREIEQAVLETFPNKYFDLESMLSFQPVLLAYWGSVSSVNGPVRGLAVRSIYTYNVEEENGKWIVKYPELHIKYDYCGNLYYVTGHEILHLVANYHLNATPEENGSHMIDRIFMNWSRVNDLPDDMTVEGKFVEHIKEICADGKTN